MSLIIKSARTGQSILELEVSGVAELLPDEMAEFLHAIRGLPVAQHFILRHGNLPPVRGDNTVGGSLDAAIGASESASRIEAARLGVGSKAVTSEEALRSIDKEVKQ